MTDQEQTDQEQLDAEADLIIYEAATWWINRAEETDADNKRLGKLNDAYLRKMQEKDAEVEYLRKLWQNQGRSIEVQFEEINRLKIELAEAKLQGQREFFEVTADAVELVNKETKKRCKAEGEVEQLKATITAMRTALEFYATARYTDTITYSADRDAGKLARDVLTKLEEKP